MGAPFARPGPSVRVVHAARAAAGCRPRVPLRWRSPSLPASVHAHASRAAGAGTRSIVNDCTPPRLSPIFFFFLPRTLRHRPPSSVGTPSLRRRHQSGSTALPHLRRSPTSSRWSLLHHPALLPVGRPPSSAPPPRCAFTPWSTPPPQPAVAAGVCLRGGPPRLPPWPWPPPPPERPPPPPRGRPDGPRHGDQVRCRRRCGGGDGSCPPSRRLRRWPRSRRRRRRW